MNRTLRAAAVVGVVAILAVAAACSDGASSGDAGADGASDAPNESDGSEEAPQTATLPQLEDWSCPDGWTRERVGEIEDVAGVEICTVEARQDCPAGQAHFLGASGCETVGSACPAAEGAFLAEAEILALAKKGTAQDIVYVRAGGPGGNGTRDKPLNSVGAAAALARQGQIIALARGVFRERVVITVALTLVGACVEGTRIEATVTGDGPQGSVAIAPSASGARVANLSLAGNTLGVLSQADKVSLSALEVSPRYPFAIVVQGGSADLVQVVVRDTERIASGWSAAVLVRDGAAARAEHLVVERCSGMGIGVDGGALTGQDVIVRQGSSAPEQQWTATGLHVNAQSTVKLERALFEGNRNAGVSVIGAAVDFVDTIIRDTLGAEGDGDGGHGLVVNSGAAVTLRRGDLQRNRREGLLVVRGAQQGAAPRLSLSDAVIRQTLPREATGVAGVGLSCAYGTEVEATRLLVLDSRGAGIFAGTFSDDKERVPSALRLVDTIVSGTDSQERDAHFGRGISLQGPIEATLERVLVDNNREIGLFLGATEGRQTATDLTIRRTATARCVDLPTADPNRCGSDQELWGGGSGVIAIDGSALELSRFDVATSFMCGLLVADEAVVRASHGSVHHNELGLCASDEGYDLSTAANETVRYHANNSNLHTAQLVLPELYPQ